MSKPPFLTMKTALIFFGGVILSSAWWCAALWPHLQNGVLFVAPIILTIVTIFAAVSVALDE
jgi:hypothetical protein